MYSKEMIEKCFINFVKQSNNNTFKIYYDDNSFIDFHLSFNYKIEDKILHKSDEYPLFKISNFPTFINKLTPLIETMSVFHKEDKSYFDFNDENFVYYLFVSCFSNMNEFDLNNPLSYIDKMIDIYSEEPILYKNQKAGNFSYKSKNLDILESIGKNIASMESPLHVQYKITDQNEVFYLPKINYYIHNNKCYIMSIQNKKTKQNNKISKDLDRYFRKVDKGLEDIEKSEDGSTNTPKDISPNALIALTLFISSHKNISSFMFPDYLPIRYQNKAGVLKSKKEDLNEVDRIQNNLTNRLLLTALRLSLHFDKSECSFNDNFFQLDFDPNTSNTDNIIYDIYNSLNSTKKIK